MLSRLNTSTALRPTSSSLVMAIPTAKLRTEPLDDYPPQWTCPLTGLIVPKRLDENLRWRRMLRSRALTDQTWRHHLMVASSNSLLFWVNAFVWTYRQKRVDRQGEERPVSGTRSHVPFITWPIQDEVVGELQHVIEKGGQVNLEKSRSMGATWIVLMTFDWYFLFHKDINFGVVSRKEELVDKSGDMDTLFEKLRYAHRMMPPWMLPLIRDRYMAMHNVELGSSIIGESSNTNVGRGGRKAAYMVDEAAAMPNGEMVENALSGNTACQIWASTPLGPNTLFHKRIKAGRGKLIQMPWYRHPEMAHGAHQVLNDLGKVTWTSRWYEKLPERFSIKTIAQEVDMEHGQSGEMFFDHTELERHRLDHQAPPSWRGDLVFLEQMPENEQIEIIQQMKSEAMRAIPGLGRQPWRLWFTLEDSRPPQCDTYVMGVDVSNGAGSSNSVMSVMAIETGKIVAKFWDAHTSPEKLAVLAAMAGIWFGGSHQPVFICWENNGPGGIFGRKLVNMCYPAFYRQRAEGTVREKRTPRWGWNSNQRRKEVLLGMYRDALGSDRMIVPCQESLDEAADYIYADDGSLIPSRLREEPGGGRQLHGDHVIADALCWLAAREMPAQRAAPVRAPRGSYAHRRRQAELAKKSDAWSP